MPRFAFALVLCLFAAPLGAQVDLFESLRPGQRVEVVLKNNTVFRGEIHWIAGDRVKVDVTYDSTELQGYLTFKRSEVRSITSLQSLSEGQKAEILEQKTARQRQLDEEAAARRAESESAEKAEEKSEIGLADYAAVKKKADERAREQREALLAKFPRPDWSEARYAEIMGKDPAVRTPDEADFVQRFGDWLEAGKSAGKEDRRKLLEKFPPEKGWGPEKMEALRVKELDNMKTGRPTYVGGQRVNNGRTRPPLTEEEVEFREHFEEWKQALKEFVEEQKAKQEDEAGGGAGGSAPEETSEEAPEQAPEGEEGGR